MSSGYLFACLCDIIVQPCQSGSRRKYRIPVGPACHGFQFPAQSVAQCHLKYRQARIESLGQFKVATVMKDCPGFIARI